MNLENYHIGKLHKYRAHNTDKMRRLVKKYGKGIVDDIDALFWKRFWTMTSVAHKYGVSRQAVKQWMDSLYPNFSMNMVSREKTNITKTELQEGCILDPMSKQQSYDIDNEYSVAVGLVSEVATQRVAISLGFNISCSKTKTIDMVLNGKSTEIKGASQDWTYNYKNYYYLFQAGESQIEKADIFVFHVQPVDLFYIIPAENVNKGMNYIKVSDVHNKIGKLSEYIERWDLFL